MKAVSAKYRNRGGVLVEKKIEETRKIMIEIAASTGLGSQETLKISRELDTLINSFESYQSKLKGRKLSRKR